MTELATTWGVGPERVLKSESSGFEVMQSFGRIIITQPFLDLMWLTGAGIWTGIQATSAYFAILEHDHLAFSPSDMRTSEGQIALDDQFDRIINKAKEMGSIPNPGDFNWPAEVPQPDAGARQGIPDWQATFDLILMAGAYAFLHEIRHHQLEQQGHTLSHVDEERACDEYARSMMLDDIAAYCATASYPEELVRTKRILGILFAKLVVLTVTPERLWSNSPGHPPVKERITTVLEAAVDPMPDWFWPTVAGTLAAFARYNGVLSGPFIAMHSRDLAFAICNLFDSK
jgi:hypothetical protein